MLDYPRFTNEQTEEIAFLAIFSGMTYSRITTNLYGRGPDRDEFLDIYIHHSRIVRELDT